MVERLMGFLETGEESVLYLLLATSIVCAAVIVERAIFLVRYRGRIRELQRRLRRFLEEDDLDGAYESFSRERSVQARILTEGLAAGDRSPEALQEMVEGSALAQRGRMERYLDILGTVGSNAPFVGLFGTVLGIIQAFRDLAQAQTAGPQVVMAGISSALVATAVGLMVAIPALVAYNYFKGRVRNVMREAEQLCKPLISYHLDRALGRSNGAASPATESSEPDPGTDNAGGGVVPLSGETARARARRANAGGRED